MPTLLADGRHHIKRAEIILLRGLNGFGDLLERERRCVPRFVSPNLATFFPYPDWSNPHRVVFCESWIKGYTAYRASQGRYAVIALNGIDGFSSGHQLVENLQPPPWGATRPDIIFCFDTPTRGNPKSEIGIRDSIARASRALADHAGAVYQTVIPLPPDEEKLGLDDFRVRTGSNEAVRMLIEGAQRIGGTVDPAEYLQLLPDTFAVEPAPEPREIIPALLPCRSGVLFAPGFERKSTVTMLLAAHVVLGRQVFGRSVTKPGRAFYVTAEDEAQDVHRTIKHMIDAGSLSLTTDQAAQLRGGLQILDVTQLPGLSTLTRKSLDGGWQAGELFTLIERAIERIGGVSLVVLDTLSSLGLSETEGMNEAAAAYHRAANALSRTHECSVLGIHHVGKQFAQNRTVDMYGARGGSAIIDNARFALQLQRDNGTPSELTEYPAPSSITPPERQGSLPSTRILRLHVHKMRWNAYDTDPRRPLWIKADGWGYSTLDALGHGASITQIQESQRKAARQEEEEIEVALVGEIRGKTDKGIPVTARELDLMKVFVAGQTKGVGKDKLRAAAERCESKGLLKKTLLGGRGNPFKWEVTDEIRTKY
jgi:hypothetical protein